MAEKTIVALYDDFSEAVAAIRELEAAGFQRKDIGLVANNAGNREGARLAGVAAPANQSDDGAGAGAGAVVGALGGGGIGLLAALGVIAVPGIGSVLAAGPVIATIAGAGLGAATGGLIGGLVGLGVEEQDAHVYAEGVRRGGALVTMRVAADQAGRAASILEKRGVVNPARRAASWQDSGWRRFDERAEPWTVARIDEDRARWRAGGAPGPVVGDPGSNDPGLNHPGSNDTGRDVRAELRRHAGAEIERESDLVAMRGGPQQSAMSGMFGSTEGGHRDGDEPRAGAVRAYDPAPENASPGERVQRVMTRDAAGDKPKTRGRKRS